MLVDVACGTGNAALLAASRGARVIGIDAAPRLLAVARERAAALGVQAEFLEGDLGALPVPDQAAEVVVSVFGVIFATDPAGALSEIARILAPDGRALVTAWVPAGPINAMLGAVGRVMARVTQQPAPSRIAWSDAEAVAVLAREAGLALMTTEAAELAIRAPSAEAYVDAGAEHPMAIAMRPALERAGAVDEARQSMLDVLQAANESKSAFLVHSPYVIHHLRREVPNS